MKIDRQAFYESVRENPFPGTLTQQQVDGMGDILTAYEDDYGDWDLRWLAYALATTYHETSATMWPIEEYGKGGNAAYAKPDPKTGQAYYGRGFVQLTWDTNYKRADEELGLTGDNSCYWHADNQLLTTIAAPTMFRGMQEGWFRTAKDGTKETLQKYFNDTRDDPYGAREIINGDKSKVPSWSNGVSIGDLIKTYHQAFLVALELAAEAAPIPEPGEETVTFRIVIKGRGPFVATIEEIDDEPIEDA